MVIWANHNMRASIQAMQNTTQNIFETKSLVDSEKAGAIATVPEVPRISPATPHTLGFPPRDHRSLKSLQVFRLQRTGELKEAENMYENPTAIAARMQGPPLPMANA
jgi:hypothetical protein